MYSWGVYDLGHSHGHNRRPWLSWQSRTPSTASGECVPLCPLMPVPMSFRPTDTCNSATSSLFTLPHLLEVSLPSLPGWNSIVSSQHTPPLLPCLSPTCSYFLGKPQVWWTPTYHLLCLQPPSMYNCKTQVVSLCCPAVNIPLSPKWLCHTFSLPKFPSPLPHPHCHPVTFLPLLCRNQSHQESTLHKLPPSLLPIHQHLESMTPAFHMHPELLPPKVSSNPWALDHSYEKLYMCNSCYYFLTARSF